MRSTVVRKLEELMAKDPRIVVLTGDLGYSVLDNIRDKFPGRFYNAGISEQAMMGIAAGLARQGKKVIVYSIIPFLIYRPFEQILIDVCYHNLPVVLLGSAEGFSYGHDAISHYALNDLSLTLQIPNMGVYAPAEPEEAAGFLEEALNSGAPAYIRLTKAKGEKFKAAVQHNDGLALVKKNGNISVVSTGGISIIAESATEQLARFGIPVTHVHVGKIKPMNTEALKRLIGNPSLIITVEEHDKTSGFGKFLADHVDKKVNIIGVDKVFEKNFGDRLYILKNQMLDSEGLAKRISDIAAARG